MAPFPHHVSTLVRRRRRSTPPANGPWLGSRSVHHCNNHHADRLATVRRM